MEVRAVNQYGKQIGRADVADIDEARAWIVRNSAPAFVDGFTVEGIGIIRSLKVDGHVVGFSRLHKGSFITGGVGIISLDDDVIEASSECRECAEHMASKETTVPELLNLPIDTPDVVAALAERYSMERA